MNFKILLLAILVCVSAVSCRRQAEAMTEFTAGREPANAVYFWKTVFNPDSAEVSFLDRHDVGRIYLRFFDVVVDPVDQEVVPAATLQFPETDGLNAIERLDGKQFVPVVYITLDALKNAGNTDGLGRLARVLVERVKNIVSYHRIPEVAELQLDCDWTGLTEAMFFQLCDSVRSQIGNQGLDWSISSTIRLHQLKGAAPPVDRGVLMVYNTGSFNDPDAENSIISLQDVEPYLKYLSGYSLPLDVAYPAYEWQLLFRSGQFVGLLRNKVNVADNAYFKYMGYNNYMAIKRIDDTPVANGDIVRHENSPVGVTTKIKSLIDKELRYPHSNIIYHLDNINLSKYTDDEIDRIYSF